MGVAFSLQLLLHSLAAGGDFVQSGGSQRGKVPAHVMCQFASDCCGSLQDFVDKITPPIPQWDWMADMLVVSELVDPLGMASTMHIKVIKAMACAH